MRQLTHTVDTCAADKETSSERFDLQEYLLQRRSAAEERHDVDGREKHGGAVKSKPWWNCVESFMQRRKNR